MLVEIVECKWCGHDFRRIPGTPGRPRLYCDDDCRKAYVKNVAQPAWAKRQRRRSLAHSIWW